MHFSKKQIDHAVQYISSRLFEDNAYSNEQKTWFSENFKVLLQQWTAPPQHDLVLRIASTENKLRGFFSHCEAQGILFNLKENYTLVPGRTMQYGLNEDNSIRITTLFQEPIPPKNKNHKAKQALHNFAQEEYEDYLQERNEMQELKDDTYIAAEQQDHDPCSMHSLDMYWSYDGLSSDNESREEGSYWTQEEYEKIFNAISAALKQTQLASYETETCDRIPALSFDFKKKVEQKREANQKHKSPTSLLKQWQVNKQQEEQPLEEIPKHVQRKRSFNQKKR